MSNRAPWVALVAVVILAIAAIIYLLNKLAVSEQLNSEATLNTKCAEWASTFYKNGGWSDTSQGNSNSYENHWNTRVHKCFIQVTQPSLKDNFVSIDVYDALEGKRYALYVGHQICDPGIVDPKTCQLDSGQIWLSGDDTKGPDYRTGFRGLGKHYVGDTNTQRDFLEHIRPLMND